MLATGHGITMSRWWREVMLQAKPKAKEKEEKVEKAEKKASTTKHEHVNYVLITICSK